MIEEFVSWVVWFFLSRVRKSLTRKTCEYYVYIIYERRQHRLVYERHVSESDTIWIVSIVCFYSVYI
ncbi:hypothetical protein AR158_c007L [Paramecium bursaria Chlorella virus AR158]|uniref:hypothetical protein n=1 Tax=Paramecium bursaria Chlorella virus AR158 TaxID=380598 RepID=UPI00015AA70B|nr:hypothetical protein AR158_c007L [Paramecium bursaria Chlorella virus AR158]ABU43553.1 hypothetical protein AR158_c007L [Paramecium bursaria Chlorella virus AR158]